MNRTKSILFLSTSVGFGDGHDYGGGEFFASEFIQEISARGWHVILICPPQSPMWRDKDLLTAVNNAISIDISIKITRPLTFFLILLKWLFISLPFRRAIIYANGYEAMKWAVAAKRIWGHPVVCHLHESTYEAYETRRARALSPYIDQFFAISRDVRDRFSRGTGTPRTKISLVYNGVPVATHLEKKPKAISEIRRQHGIPDACPVVLMAARTNPEKGHAVFLKAAELVLRSRPDVVFFIAGLQEKNASEKWLYRKILDQIQNSRLEKNVLHIDYTPEARALMRCSDIIVVPSTAEGFGRTAIEAMAEGTPVIASKTGGLAEIIVHDVNGLHFPVGDEHALATEILFLLGNPEKCRHLAEKGRETVLAHFSTGIMTSEIECLLLTLR
jgi:glycosyltransferase involved in cell wall biosynthesis